MFGHQPVVEALLHRGADIGAKDLNQLTALHLAASRGHVDVVRALLESERMTADIFSQASAEGLTVLHLASKEGHAEVVDALLLFADRESLGHLIDQRSTVGFT